MILFLDFDGVLHPINASNNGGVFCKVSILWQILRACPSVEVVFSTSWREDFSIDQLTEFVTFGGEDLAHRFVGTTPSVVREKGASYTGQYSRRETECRLWLAGNNRRESWVALDDVAPDFSPACPSLYLIDQKTGLTEEDAHYLYQDDGRGVVVCHLKSEVAAKTRVMPALGEMLVMNYDANGNLSAIPSKGGGRWGR